MKDVEQIIKMVGAEAKKIANEMREGVGDKCPDLLARIDERRPSLPDHPRWQMVGAISPEETALLVVAELVRDDDERQKSGLPPQSTIGQLLAEQAQGLELAELHILAIRNAWAMSQASIANRLTWPDPRHNAFLVCREGVIGMVTLPGEGGERLIPNGVIKITQTEGELEVRMLAGTTGWVPFWLKS